MERILLFSSPADDEFDPCLRTNVAEPPLGLLYLWTALEQSSQCAHISLADAYIDPAEADRLPQAIKKTGATQLWVSIMSSEGKRCLGDFVPKLRNLYPKLKLVAGGAYFRKLDEKSLRRFVGEYDLVVVGDADLEVEEVLNASGIYRCRPLPRFVELAYPKREAVDLEAYTGAERAPHHLVIGARGCTGTCSFCAIACRRPYLRHPREIGLEIQYLFAKTGIHCFSVVDDVMALQPQRFDEYLPALEKLPNHIQLDVSWRIDRFSEDIACRLAKARVRVVRFGVESIDKETQQVLGKRYSRDQVVDAVRWCNYEGISPCLYFMIGFPTDTEEKISELISFMADLSQETKVPPYLGILRVLEGTPLMKYYRDRGWLIGKDPKRGLSLEVMLQILGEWRARFPAFFIGEAGSSISKESGSQS